MEIIIALISAGSAIAVCMINNAYQVKKVQTQHDETIALIKYQIAELSDRVDKHNNLHIERMRRAVFLRKHFGNEVCPIRYMAVSYTHLDVYKRQAIAMP